MFGKIFASLYKGSMVGSGPVVFAIWSYVIANMEPDGEIRDKEDKSPLGMMVELNPDYIWRIIGKITEKDVSEAIEKLCSPDPKSTSPEHGGRRLLHLGGFMYRVVNGGKYRAMRDADERKRQLREAQDRYRKNHPKFPKRGKPSPR